MCGRFTELTNPNQLGFPFGDWEPRYNIAPTMNLLALRSGNNVANGEPVICQLRWGLIPSWSKDLKIGYRTINARSETISEKPAFRSAFKSRRCLIIADGYYEWRKGSDTKQTFYFRRVDRKPFVFLGLWETWKGPPNDPLQSPLESCTIITTKANELTSPIHDRMPCLGELNDEKLDAWLDPGFQNVAHLKSLLDSYSNDDMEAVQVESYVNKVANEGPQCIEELQL